MTDFSRKMSVQNMIAMVRWGHRPDGKHTNEVKFAGEESKDKLYEPKHKKKAFRVMTVIAYIISVSLAAIILSLYYAFIWDSRVHATHLAQHASKPLGNVTITATVVRVDCLNTTSNHKQPKIAPYGIL